MPVTCYSQLMTVAYGGTGKNADLDGHVIRAKKLEEIAVKLVPINTAYARAATAAPDVRRRA